MASIQALVPIRAGYHSRLHSKPLIHLPNLRIAATIGRSISDYSTVGALDVMESWIVGKLDVVAAQLSEAIRLFFEQRDPVVVHTLVASAHQILFDLGKSRGVGSQIKNSANLDAQEVQEFLRAVNYPYNFFKHADRDPESKIDVGPLFQLTADFLMDGVLMLQKIAGVVPIQARIYWAWFVSYYHEQFANLPPDGEIAKLQKQDLGSKSFNELSAVIKCAELASDGA